MKRFVTAIALSACLSFTAMGGDIPSVGLQTEDQDPPATATAPGEIPMVTGGESTTDAFLGMLQTVWSLM